MVTSDQITLENALNQLSASWNDVYHLRNSVTDLASTASTVLENNILQVFRMLPEDDLGSIQRIYKEYVRKPLWGRVAYEFAFKGDERVLKKIKRGMTKRELEALLEQTRENSTPYFKINFLLTKK